MSLKQRTANTLKWSLVDRVLQQVLYAVTGIVLARILSQTDFGLVGAVLVFQAFASLIIDSGFSYALIQRKEPTQTDYSTVLWFNIGVSAFIYILLWFAAPLIADCFQHDARLIPLSRVLFLSLVINAFGSVQTNRLQKTMNMRPVAVANAIALAAGAVAGIWLAVTGYGAWAIVWQTIVSAAVRSGMLWSMSGWHPSAVFDAGALRSLFGIGGRMMFTSFLNTVFLNIYSFIIGSFVSLRALGYYTQSDKWSKMGIMSISQTLTTAFLPALSSVQDDKGRFMRIVSKMNRFTGYILFPAMLGLAALAEPIFHFLFGSKWDPSILLFQLLLVRGVFTVLNGLYNNYMLALGHAKPIMWLEVMRDAIAIVALVLTFPYMSLSTDTNPVEGLAILLSGQLVSSAITYIVTLIVCCRYTEMHLSGYLRDLAPYFLLTMILLPMILWINSLHIHAALQLAAGGCVALAMYMGVNYLAGSQIQKDILAFARGKKVFD